MKDNMFLTFMFKTMFVTLVLCVLDFLSGKFLLPVVFSGRHVWQLPKAVLLATVLAMCSLIFCHWLTYAKGMRSGSVIPVTILSHIIILLVLLVLVAKSDWSFIRLSVQEHTIDYFSLLVVSAVSLLLLLPLSGLYKFLLWKLKQ